MSEEYYFAYSAALRIFGEIDSLEEITTNMGIEPTYQHTKGEKKKGRIFENTMWLYQIQLPEGQPLHEHIDALSKVIDGKIAYLKKLKEKYHVDIFLGYRSNCDTGGIEVPYQSLDIFKKLEIPFGISIIIA